MELFVINTYLSLLIFNPLEAAVLFLAATGDFRQVFSKRFIKHWFILGSINFVFQYLASCLDIGFARLFINHFNSILTITFILYIYMRIFIKNKILLKICFYSALFNAISAIIGIMIGTNIFGLFVISGSNIVIEICINFIIKIIQFFILYIFVEVFYEKIRKKTFN